MISTVRSVGGGLQAALLLARGRIDGLLLLDGPADARMALARRSFWAMALCLPALLCLDLLGWIGAGKPAHPAHDLAADLLTFVIGWLTFALASHRIAQRSGRAALWWRFMAAWNWCSVVQYLLMVAASLPGVLGAPDLVAEAVWLFAFGWVIWIEWFVSRVALELPAGAAVGMVMLDLGIGLAITALAQLMV